MKILRLTPHFYYPAKTGAKWNTKRDPIGGMQTQIYRLANKMSEKGIDQTILTIGMEGAKSKVDLNGYSLISSNLFIVPIRSRIRGTVGLNFYWGLGTILKVIGLKIKELRKKEKFDFIHSHCSGVIAPLAVGYISKLILRKKLAYTIHCSRIATYKPMSKFDEIINGLVMKIEKFCLENADIVYVISENTKAKLEEKLENIKDKMFLISDVISFSEFQEYASKYRVNEFKVMHQVPSGKKIITYIGRVAHEKGWKYFVEAIKHLNDEYHFLICGDGNERNELNKLIKKYKLEDKCTLTGFISNEEVASALSLTDVLVIPSLHEEFGSLLLEAAAIGTVVIASNVGGLSQNIQHMHSGLLVEPKDSNEIVSNIKFLESNVELKKQFKENLNKSIANKYEVSVICEKMISDFNELISV